MNDRYLGMDSMINIRANIEAADKRAGRHDAEGVFDHLQHRIAVFQKEMPETHEVAIQLANFGVAAEIHIRTIRYKNPNLIEFGGLLADGNTVNLVQHISQLNFLLVAAPPLKEETQPFRIGFLP